MTPRARSVAAAVVLAAGIGLGLTGPAPTQAQQPPPGSRSGPPPVEARLRRVQDRRRSLEKDLQALRSQEQSLLGEVERLELEVRLRTEEAREAQLELERTNLALDRTLKRVRSLQASLAAERPGLKARARDLYKLGELSYLRLLLSVEHPADFLSGYRYVMALARRDQERVKVFRRDLDDLSSQQSALKERTRDAMQQRAELERRRRALDADRKRKTALLTSLVEKKEINATYVAELKQAEDRLGGLLEGLSSEEVTVPISAFKGSLPWPARGRVSASFGRRRHPRFDTYTVLNGIELDTAEGSPVGSVHEGQVAFADRFRGYGLMVVVDHGDKHHTLYAHLGEIEVKTGDHVVAGTPLGTAGPHDTGDRGLYFEMRFQGRPEDPADWLAGDRSHEPKR